MKTLKRISALLIAITMMVAMSAVAFADGEATGKTITITGGKKGHTYTAC